MKILITGATGSIGPQVVRALHMAGYDIRILSRIEPPNGILPPNLDVSKGDITDPEAVMAAMQDCDIIVHMAALLHILNPEPNLMERYKRVNLEGTANIVKAAKQVGISRLVFFSTIAVYGSTNRQILTEETVPQPDTLYGQTKLAGEQIVLNANHANGEPLGVVLRLGAVYGSRVKGNYQRLLYTLAKRRFIPLGKGENRRTLVYDEDVAAATLLAVKSANAGGKIYNVTDGQFHTLHEIILAISKGLGRQPPQLSLPVSPIQWLIGVIEDTTKWMNQRPLIARATLDKYLEDVAVDGQRIQKELGFVPGYDLETGWRKTIQELKRIGKL